MEYGKYYLQLHLVHKAQTDFGRARSRALVNRFMSVVTGRDSGLLSFEKAQESAAIRGHIDRGLRDVAISRIVGSVGRYHEFDRSFNPIHTYTRSRWVNVNLAALAGADIPPVELYLLNGQYFVNDGHHRISVSKNAGADSIEAHVIEFLADVEPGGGCRSVFTAPGVAAPATGSQVCAPVL